MTGFRLNKILAIALAIVLVNPVICISVGELLNGLVTASGENGIMEVGIAAGADPALDSVHRLRILKGSVDCAKLIECAVSYIPPMTDEFVYKFLVAAAYAVFIFGLVPAGDRNEDLVEVAANGTHPVGEPPSSAEIREAATFIAATKVNFFTSNHHVGQGRMSGYPLKVATNLLARDGRRVEDFYNAGHTVGHWADTKIVLAQLGFSAIPAPASLCSKLKLGAAADVSVRRSAAPAGTAKLHIAHAATSRLIVHPLFAAFPGAPDLVRVTRTQRLVSANPISFHLGARYLTGAPRADYDDAQWNGVLGRLGSFICNVFPQSTLAKSPHLMKDNRKTYQDYDDYNAQFDALCASYVTTSAAALEEVSMELMGAYVKPSAEAQEATRKQLEELLKRPTN